MLICPGKFVSLLAGFHTSDQQGAVAKVIEKSPEQRPLFM